MAKKKRYPDVQVNRDDPTTWPTPEQSDYDQAAALGKVPKREDQLGYLANARRTAADPESQAYLDEIHQKSEAFKAAYGMADEETAHQALQDAMDRRARQRTAALRGSGLGPDEQAMAAPQRSAMAILGAPAKTYPALSALATGQPVPVAEPTSTSTPWSPETMQGIVGAGQRSKVADELETEAEQLRAAGKTDKAMAKLKVAHDVRTNTPTPEATAALRGVGTGTIVTPGGGAPGPAAKYVGPAARTNPETTRRIGHLEDVGKGHQARAEEYESRAKQLQDKGDSAGAQMMFHRADEARKAAQTTHEEVFQLRAPPARSAGTAAPAPSAGVRALLAAADQGGMFDAARRPTAVAGQPSPAMPPLTERGQRRLAAVQKANVTAQEKKAAIREIIREDALPQEAPLGGAGTPLQPAPKIVNYGGAPHQVVPDGQGGYMLQPMHTGGRAQTGAATGGGPALTQEQMDSIRQEATKLAKADVDSGTHWYGGTPPDFAERFKYYYGVLTGGDVKPAPAQAPDTTPTPSTAGAPPSAAIPPPPVDYDTFTVANLLPQDERAAIPAEIGVLTLKEFKDRAVANPNDPAMREVYKRLKAAGIP